MEPHDPLIPPTTAPRPAPRRRRAAADADVAGTPLLHSPFTYLLPSRAASVLPTRRSDGGAALSRAPSDVEAQATAGGGFRPPAPRSPPGAVAATATLFEPAAEVEGGCDGGGFLFPPRAGAGSPAPSVSAPPSPSSRLAVGVTYGVIQSIVALPTMVSFAAIVWRRGPYAPHLAALAKLAFLSSGLHQSVFTALSSLPYAVGQVQDVGLLLLSAMTADIAERAAAAKAPAAAAVATALVTLAAATAFTGIALLAMARAKAAGYVQNVPLPVVAGYLSYVAVFCGTAGLGLAANADLNTVAGWREALGPDGAPKMAACAATSAFLYCVIKRARHPAALPVAIATVPALFYGALAAGGWSLADAAAHGWTLPATAPEPFWRVYDLFAPGPYGFLWGAAAAQIPRAVALAAVVTFGSCLDIAAIQADTPEDLSFDHELATVGASNLLAGALGAGLTGSYIFSCVLFSMRAGVAHRAHGAIISASLLAAFLSPVDLVSLAPSYFYGSLLVVFAIEIGQDWLVRSRAKVGGAEYGLTLLTLASIIGLGLESGIGVGFAASAAAFVWRYARTTVTALTVVPSRAGAARPAAERAALAALGERWAIVGVDGYVFFGSSVSISRRVGAVADALAAVKARAARVAAGANPCPVAAAAAAAAPVFLLLDFGRVRGVDATAAASFASLARRCAGAGVALVVCGLRSKRVARLLAAHGFALAAPASATAPAPPPPAGGGGGGLSAFESVDDAVYAAEEAFLVALRAARALPPAKAASRSVPTTDDVAAALAAVAGGGAAAEAAAAAAAFLSVAAVPPGAPLFRPGEPADALFIVLRGVVELRVDLLASDGAPAPALPASLAARAPSRAFFFGPGSVVGTSDFFGGAGVRRGAATALPPGGAAVATLTRSALARVEGEAPAAAVALLRALLAAETQGGRHALEVLERSAAGR